MRIEIKETFSPKTTKEYVCGQYQKFGYWRARIMLYKGLKYCYLHIPTGIYVNGSLSLGDTEIKISVKYYEKLSKLIDKDWDVFNDQVYYTELDENSFPIYYLLDDLDEIEA